MNIGVIGVGVVGQACAEGFRGIGHDVALHDIKLQTKITNLLECEVVFLCVPTPSHPDGSCNTTIVESCVEELNSHNYIGSIAIKSTVSPGTTRRLSEHFEKLDISFVPEFLRERCAYKDFTENHDLLAIGSENKTTVQKIIKCHGKIPKKTISMTPTEAEILKYFNNVFNAARIIFGNNFFELCEEVGADYSVVLNAYKQKKHHICDYLEVNENLRGYGGGCLPKDKRAIIAMMKNSKTDLKFF